MCSWIHLICISDGSKTWGFGRYLELWAYYNFKYKLYLASYMEGTMVNLYSLEKYLELCERVTRKLIF